MSASSRTLAIRSQPEGSELLRKDTRIYVAGHNGLAGSAIVRRLREGGWTNLLLKSRAELDLVNQSAVDHFFASEKPEVVILAAAKVGGIAANSAAPASFLIENLQIQTNVLTSAHSHGVRKLVFLGSSCIYPRLAPQPLKEASLLTGPLEQTNEWYAVAKIAGIKTCQALRRQHGFDAISLMPTNLYGPNDNFDLNNSHVLPALMRKFHEAKVEGKDEVVVWGTGSPLREFMHVDDLADAVVFLTENYSAEDIVNVGTAEEISIRDLACLMAKVVGFDGNIVQDSTKPDGTPRKLLDVSRLASIGWRAKIPLEHGLARTYAWYRDQNRPPRG